MLLNKENIAGQNMFCDMSIDVGLPEGWMIDGELDIRTKDIAADE